MANYNETQQLLQQLKPIINQCIENHPSVKSAIKAKKATVDTVNTTNKTVTVQFPFDETLVTLPYNPKMENYLTTNTATVKTVSVWYYQSINNGVVMEDGEWSIAENEKSDLIDLIYPIGSIYMSVNNVNPQTLFGGSWEKIEGQFLLGSSSNYANGSTGGSADAVVVSHRGHILHTEAGGSDAGENTYYFNYPNDTAVIAQYSTTRPLVLRAGNEVVLRDFEEGEDGIGKNMPPYLTVNIWKRTA